MKVFVRPIFCALAALLCCLGHAEVVTAEDLPSMDMTMACVDEYINVGLLIEARQQGLTKAQALETNRTAQEKYKIDPQAIENAFAQTELSKAALMAHSLWVCAARKRGLTAEPIGTVALELDQCVKRSKGDLCWQQLRNVVWKLPRDFSPKSGAAPAVQPKPSP